MLRMITRARKISDARCIHLTKEKLQCNTVRYLSTSSATPSKVAKFEERDISNKKQIKILADKKGFCCEVNKRRMQRKRYLESYSNVERGNRKNRPLLAVYDRITRAKSKKILGTQMRCSNEDVDIAYMKELGMVGEGINAMEGKRIKRPLMGSRAQVEESFCQAQFDFGQGKQERMTRAKKNRLLQIQADKENVVSECMREPTCRERCPLKITSGNKSFLTYSSMLQGKRKRMLVNMCSKGLEGDCCIPETGLQSEISTKLTGNDVSEQECQRRVITRGAMHRENVHTMIEDQTVCCDFQSNNDFQNQSKEVEVTDEKQREFTDFAQLRKKSSSCKGSKFEEKGNNAGVCLAKQIKSRMQSNQNYAGSRDSRYWNRNLRNRKCSVDTDIIDSSQVSQDPLNEKVRERGMNGSTRFKVFSTTAVPRRVTRSMNKSSRSVEKIEQKWVRMRCIIPHQADHKGGGHRVSVKNLRGMKKKFLSSTVECMKEKLERGRTHIEDEDGMGLNSTEEANLISSGKSDVKYRTNSGCNNISAFSNEDGCQDSKLCGSKTVIEDVEGKGHPSRISKQKKKQNSGIRKEYLTRSKQENINIQGDTARHAVSEMDVSTSFCAFGREGGFENSHQESKLCGSEKAPENSECKGHLCRISKWNKQQISDTEKGYLTRSKHEDIYIQGDVARHAVSEIGTELETGCKSCCDGGSEILRPGINDGNNFANSSWESKLSASKNMIEDSEVKGHLCRNSKWKKKQNSNAPPKEYLTRSKFVDRNIQGEMPRGSVSAIDVASSHCDKGGLSHSIEEDGKARLELMRSSPPAPKDEPNVLLEVNLAGSAMEFPQQKLFRKSSGEFQSMNVDCGSHLSLELEQREVNSTGQDISVSEQIKSSLPRSQTSMMSHEQCNDFTNHERQISFLEGSGVKGLQKQNLILGLVDGESAFLQDTSNSEATNIKADVIVDPDYDCSKRKTPHFGTSYDYHERYWSEFKKKRIATTSLLDNNSKQCEVSYGKALDDHDMVETSDYWMTGVKRRCFRVMTNPNGVSGRQMRPRPLDPQQPLPIFVEGRDQEFHDCDGVSSHWLLKQQDSDNPSNYPMDAAAGSKVEPQKIPSSFHVKKQDIKIPSYRTVLSYDEEQGRLRGRKSTYIVPQSYIRHMETAAKSQKNVVEYDMEDDDQEWLQKLNEGIAERKMESPLSEDEFEKLIEYFENKSAQVSVENEILLLLNDAHKNSKDQSRPTLNLKIEKTPMSDNGKQVPGCAWEKGSSSRLSYVPQMSDCCICNGGENSASNPVYKCKSCLIYVHQSCYGVYGSCNAGQACSLDRSSWHCRKCEVFGGANVDVCCVICLKNGGALKPTTDPAKWAHVVCALYTNETFFVNTDSMEPIDGVSSVELRSRRQKRLCCFCGSRLGSCERCSAYGCGVTFHISCGVNRGAYFELQHTNQQVVRVRSFCPRHANVAPVPGIGEGNACLKDKELTYEKDMSKEDRYSSDLHRPSKNLQSDQGGSSAWRYMDDGQLQWTGTEGGSIKEEANMKDRCQSPQRHYSSFPKRQRRQISRSRTQSADGKDICEPPSQKNMLVIDPRSNDDFDRQRDDDGSVLYSTDGNQKLQGLQLSDCTINGDANVGLVGGSVSDKEGDQLINLEEVLEANVGPASIVREVYSYWLCKRVKKKGPLLQKFQQEQAAKRHDIFNQDSSGLMAYFGLKEDPTNMVAGYGLINIETVTQKLMGLQRELKQLRSISKQIINRERVKAQLLSVVQKIAEMKLFVLQKNLGLMSCFSCKSSQNVLHCAYCMRIFCFECYKLWNGCGMKSYRILSCRSCICRDCGASKSEYLSHPSENVLRKPEMENRESLFSTEVSKGLVGCSRSDLACGSAPTKPHGEGRNKGSEVKNEPFSTHIANMVCSMPECTDSRTNCLLNPNMPKSHTTYSFSPLAAGTGPSEEIGGHPLEGKGRQWNPCKTVLLSELADVVGLSPGSLPVKSASSYCHNNVQRNRCKKKKIKSSDAIAVSS